MTGEAPSLTAQRAAEEELAAAMAHGATQYIVLGAGLDSRTDGLQAAAGLAYLVNARV